MNAFQHNTEHPVSEDRDTSSANLKGLSDLPQDNNNDVQSGYQINPLLVSAGNQSLKLTQNPFYHVGQANGSSNALSLENSMNITQTENDKLKNTQLKALAGSHDAVTIERLDDTELSMPNKSKNAKTSELKELTQVRLVSGRSRSRINESTLRNAELNVTFNSNQVDLTRLDNPSSIQESRRASRDGSEYILSQLHVANESSFVNSKVNMIKLSADQKNNWNPQLVTENPEQVVTENTTTRVLKETPTETDRREVIKLEDGSERQVRSCRICLEEEEGREIGKFINACQCNGTMGLIHDECLKTWLVAKGLGADGATCELCKAKFHMTFKEKLRFYPKHACDEGLGSLLSCMCLSIIMGGLAAVIILIVANWNNSNNTANNPIQQNSLSFKVVVVTICGFIALMLAVLAFISCKDAFCIQEIANWKILDWTPEWQREQDQLEAREAANQNEQERNSERSSQRQQSLVQNLSNGRNDRTVFSPNHFSSSNNNAQAPENSERSAPPLIRLNQERPEDRILDRNSSQLPTRTNEAERIVDLSVNESIHRLNRTHDDLLHHSHINDSSRFLSTRRQHQIHLIEERKLNFEGEQTTRMNEAALSNQTDKHKVADDDENEINRIKDLLKQHNQINHHEFRSLEEEKVGPLVEKSNKQTNSRPQTPQEIKNSHLSIPAREHQNSVPRLLQSISPKFLQGSKGDNLIFEVRVNPNKKDASIEIIMDSNGKNLLYG